MSEFREFWIRFRIGDNESTHQITDVSLNPLGSYKEDFHVIEYAALEQANVKIKELEANLTIAVEALEGIQRASTKGDETSTELECYYRAGDALEKLRGEK